MLAGVNGAGKSSIGGAHLRESGGEYYNPDEVARAARDGTPGLTQEEANAFAWKEGKQRLEQAIAEGSAFNFETTLGGNTITRLLLEAAEAGANVDIWFVGLASVELHLKRVAARVKKGGHDIPEENIRRRWNGSRRNLMLLIPHVANLRVYDNSAEADPATGKAPRPVLVLEIVARELTVPLADDLTGTPEWAKPIVYAAYAHFGLAGE